ncbi:ubiquinol-cytochrome c reductase complex assembly factor 2 isoform X1 [Notamacropus eugenii]|uniref:ubiquinol-cytochrome c reductase complex assembly factor 2 isoform X1 n=1 Tax=Notamacropus eugenii TaxID=9315 RepID=UPI003B67D003
MATVTSLTSGHPAFPLKTCGDGECPTLPHKHPLPFCWLSQFSLRSAQICLQFSPCGPRVLLIAEPETCDQMYESLARLHSNYYKHKYPRPRDTGFSGLTVEECRIVLATDTLEEFKELNKSLWKKLQDKFATKNPDEKTKE